ncbi:hypothetical protein EG329_000123 [Mollisiaceae sp. DMI_Dod_QoI]|nr:hypothetical protein EG329_000123 [Helotiales sp. DMI_Dod_QoI]
MGWTPVQTAGGDRGLCGYHGLCNSMINAMDLFGINVNGPRPSVQELQELKISTEFEASVHAWLGQLNLPAGDVPAIKREYMALNNLSEESVMMLLRLANGVYNTNFDLGVVMRGYRVRWSLTVAGELGFDESFVAATGTSRPAVGRGRPTIWLYNDRADEKAAAHTVGGVIDDNESVSSHWESFGPPRAPAAGQPLDRHPQIVRDWGLGQMVRDHVQIVYGTNGTLTANVGHFVRAATAPAEEAAPAGQTYVQLGRSNEEGADAGLGWLAEASLRQVTLDASAPVPGITYRDPRTTSSPQGTGAEVPFRIFRKVDPLNKVGGALADESGMAFFEPGRFGPVGGFDVGLGDFLLDSRERPNELALVTNIRGVSGSMSLRKLQYVERPWGCSSTTLPLFDARGGAGAGAGEGGTQQPKNVTVEIDGQPVVVPIPDEWWQIDHSNKNQGAMLLVADPTKQKPAVGTLLEALGGSVEGDKPLKEEVIWQIGLIIDACIKNNTGASASANAVPFTLPLYTMNAGLGSNGEQPTAFLEGEVVRLWRAAPDAARNNNVVILDFEGNQGAVPLAGLTAIDTAFGLRLNAATVPDEFRTDGQPVILIPGSQPPKESKTPRTPTEKKPKKLQKPKGKPKSKPKSIGPTGRTGVRTRSQDYQARPDILADLATIDRERANSIIRATGRAAGHTAADVNAALWTGLEVVT